MKYEKSNAKKMIERHQMRCVIIFLLCYFFVMNWRFCENFSCMISIHINVNNFCEIYFRRNIIFKHIHTFEFNFDDNLLQTHHHFWKIYSDSSIQFFENIFTCFDICTTNIFMTRNYYDYHFRKSITNRYLLKRNFYEAWSKVCCISLLLILQCILFAIFYINDIYFNYFYNYF